MSTLYDPTVVMDSGFVSDGHHICWNGPHGAFVGHPEECLYYIENRMRVYLCSPGLWAAQNGISLDDLPTEQAEFCRQVNIGSEAIKWRLQEFVNTNLSIEEQDAMSIFEIELDHALPH